MARHLLPLLAAAPLFAQEPPQTTPERTDHQQTSTLADVNQFIAACTKLPHGNRLTVGVAGKSHEGRDLPMVRAALPGAGKDRLRALIIGNIHAGEVEGKETIQVLLREIAQGEHTAVLEKIELTFLPVYNADGNERIDPKNRVSQNGPTGGVGVRENAQRFDLNRDFVKADAPETRVLLALFRELDPHLFMDLHTTNGSYHGYQLTYAPCLSPNADPELAALNARLLAEVRTGLAKDGLQTFDYGNFDTGDFDGGGAPSNGKQQGWFTYDSRARYGINYFGLRNRLSVLSEAYSYCDFKTRIAATRSFVLGCAGWLAGHHDEVKAATAAADTRLLQPGQTFGFATKFAPPQQEPVLRGEVDKIEVPGLGTRLAAKPDSKPETMPVVRAFVAGQSIPLPDAWAIAAPDARVVELLDLHGVPYERLTAPRTVTADRFHVTAKRKPRRPYQGHQELELKGEWRAEPAPVELPAGTLLIAGRQRFARLAAQLLEPQSEDSLSTWNFLEAATGDTYPVLRVKHM